MKKFIIGITGSHSTGKTTFRNKIATSLRDLGYSVGEVEDLAISARDKGFPILKEHTFESTAWIISRCIQKELEACLKNDVVIVDRPVFDALGYFRVAEDHRKEKSEDWQIEYLNATVRSYSTRYNILFKKTIDPDIPLGEGRPTDLQYREDVEININEAIQELRLSEIGVNILSLNPNNTNYYIEDIKAQISS